MRLLYIQARTLAVECSTEEDLSVPKSTMEYDKDYS
jgi:hypothetical protein